MWCCQVNGGRFQSVGEKRKLIIGNLALKQVHFYAGQRHNSVLIKNDLFSTLQNLKIQSHFLLFQLQATMLSLLACVLSTVFGWIAEGKMAFKHVVILCSACISSAFLASLIQGTRTLHCMKRAVFGSIWKRGKAVKIVRVAAIGSIQSISGACLTWCDLVLHMLIIVSRVPFNLCVMSMPIHRKL